MPELAAAPTPAVSEAASFPAASPAAPSYRAAGVVLVRASVFGPRVGPSWWPTAGAPAPVWARWLAQAWTTPGLAEAIGEASPDLARRVQRIHAGADIGTAATVRAAFATARYLLRARGRATPYGRFAGVTAATVGAPTRTEWAGPHRGVGHDDPGAVAELVAELEGDRSALGSLLVQTNALYERRAGRLVVTWQPHASAARHAEVSVRDSAPVRAALAAAAEPITVAALSETLRSRFPAVSQEAADRMVAGLMRCGALVSEVRPPSTVTEPWKHVQQIAARIGAPGSARAQPPGGVDLALGGRYTVPATVLAEIARAGELLARVGGDTPGRVAWRSWHTAFLRRYGAGAQVAIREAVDPVTGLGWPAHLTGATDTAGTTGPDEFDDGHDESTASIGSVGSGFVARDRWLAEQAQDAALTGAREVVLTDSDLAALSASSAPVMSGAAGFGQDRAGWAGWAAHMSVCAQLHAGSRAAVDDGDFRVHVTGVGRTGASLLGRHLRVLAAADRDRVAAALRDLPAAVDGASVVQLGAPPYRTATEILARVPQILPRMLGLGEHRDSGIRLDDLSVLADHHGLYLLHREELVEPVAVDALAAHAVTRWARFLAELPGACSAPVRGFNWGAANGLPFRPRLRVGKVVLTAARWRLNPAWLPGPEVDERRWRAVLDDVRDRRGIPARVAAGTQDRRLHLDLTRPMDTAVLRSHLSRAGAPVTLVEAPGPAELGWADGHAHELVVPLVAEHPPRAAPACLARRVPIRPAADHHGYLPGTPGVVSAWMTCDPRAVPALITHELPALRSRLGGVRLWWLPMRSPRPHLRLRIHTDHPGTVIEHVASWAADLRTRGLTGDLTFDTYRPEIARYGHGPDPAAAMDAAEALFAADCDAATTQLRHKLTANDESNTGDTLLAATAASLLDLATALTGPPAEHGDHDDGDGRVRSGLAWLVRRADLAGKRPVTDRSLIPHARTLWTEPPPPLAYAWQNRAAAAAAYRRALHDQTTETTSAPNPVNLPSLPDTVVVSLLHLHCVRVHQPDPDAEQLVHRIARSVALGILNPRRTR